MLALTSPGRGPRACVLRFAAICAAFGPWLAFSGVAGALGLGEIVQQSSLGEPFRATIPVLTSDADAAGELAPECFRLVASERSDLPQIVFGRAALARNAQGLFVVVSGNAIVEDPAVSFTVQAGCRSRIRHPYTALLDPPIIREPVAAATSHHDADRSRTRAKARHAHAGHAASVSSPTTGRARPSASGSAKIDTSPTKKTSGTTATTKPGAVAADSRRMESAPQLRVSRSAREPSSGRASDVARADSDEDMRDLEAETIALQRRIAELAVTLERMDSEIAKARAERAAAERSAHPTAESSATAAQPPAAVAPSPSQTAARSPTIAASKPSAPVVAQPSATAAPTRAVTAAATPAATSAPGRAGKNATATPLIADRVKEASAWLVPLALPAVLVLGVAAVFRLRHARSPRRRSALPLDAVTLGAYSTLAPAVADGFLEPGPSQPGGAPPASRSPLERVPPAALHALNDEESSFEEDLIRYAEQASTHSVLEREHPKLVASIVRDWGRSKALALLRETLVSPRRAAGGFSQEAIAELMLLQALAMERAGYNSEDNPWSVELGQRRRA